MSKASENQAKSASGWYELAMSHLEAGKVPKAISCLEEALELDLAYAPAYFGLGNIFMDMGNFTQAIGCYAMAVESDPSVHEYKRKFAHYSQLLQVQEPNEKLKGVVFECLKTPGVDTYPMSALWCSLMVQEPPFRALFDVSGKPDYEAFGKAFDALGSYDFFTGDFFLSSLKGISGHHRNFENAFNSLRRMLLENLGKQGWHFTREDYTALAAALGHYCFFTDYIFNATDEEKSRVEALRAEAEDGKIGEDGLAILSCYVPLYRLKGCEALLKTFAGSKPLRDLLKLQVSDPLERQEIAKSIKAITPIEDEVSQQVRRQYEQAPYPCWRGYSTEHKHKTFEGPGVAAGGEILIAGCGTGQDAIEMAAKHPDARVTAVDLSLTSLSFAIQRAQRYGIKNISFAQADILQLGSIGRPFDFIVSAGVLHHMKEPEAGWRVLESLLKPGGSMRISLYSKHGRRSIIRAQEWIKNNNHGSDDDAIRRFRAQIDEIMDEEDVKALLRVRDYYYLPECRDLLFHVQEHNGDLEGLDNIIKALGLEFLGFYLREEVLIDYRMRTPLDLKGRNLKSWSRYEAKNPGIFAEMYTFWCRKPAG